VGNKNIFGGFHPLSAKPLSGKSVFRLWKF